jgi:hypothetical protein
LNLRPPGYELKRARPKDTRPSHLSQVSPDDPALWALGTPGVLCHPDSSRSEIWSESGTGAAIVAAFDLLGSFYAHPVVRPESWISPAGESPVWVSTGAPSSRPRFVGEIWRAERGVKSLLPGSKITGRQPSLWTTNPRAPLHPSHASPTTTTHHPCPAKIACVPLVVTSGESYRMREARTTQGGRPNKS